MWWRQEIATGIVGQQEVSHHVAHQCRWCRWRRPVACRAAAPLSISFGFLTQFNHTTSLLLFSVVALITGRQNDGDVSKDLPGHLRLGIPK